MSRRTADANKAIRQAWERERKLVQEGKGTRDWTEEQQTDILNPDKGKAYDVKGRAFDGQHMKSVEKYPEYQGNPDNIQFLTKEEHLKAHKGSWQNPTNWQYDPVTGEFIDFGDEEIITCKIIELSNPIVVIVHATDSGLERTEKKSPPEKKTEEVVTAVNKKNATLKTPTSQSIKSTESKSSGKLVKGLKTVGKFIAAHPIESIEIAGTVIVGTAKIVSSIRTGNRSNSAHTSKSGTSSVPSNKSDIVTKVADIVEKANRALPCENDVPAHKQRYHTKNGVVWKDKASYHRPRKNS